MESQDCNLKEIMTEDRIQWACGLRTPHGPHAVAPNRNYLRMVYLGEDVRFTRKSRTSLESIA